jgi:hypothetical protein
MASSRHLKRGHSNLAGEGVAAERGAVLPGPDAQDDFVRAQHR